MTVLANSGGHLVYDRPHCGGSLTVYDRPRELWVFDKLKDGYVMGKQKVNLQAVNGIKCE